VAVVTWTAVEVITVGFTVEPVIAGLAIEPVAESIAVDSVIASSTISPVFATSSRMSLEIIRVACTRSCPKSHGKSLSKGVASIRLRY
jgi:hypothetical protein